MIKPACALMAVFCTVVQAFGDGRDQAIAGRGRVAQTPESNPDVCGSPEKGAFVGQVRTHSSVKSRTTTTTPPPPSSLSSPLLPTHTTTPHHTREPDFYGLFGRPGMRDRIGFGNRILLTTATGCHSSLGVLKPFSSLCGWCCFSPSPFVGCAAFLHLLWVVMFPLLLRLCGGAFVPHFLKNIF